MNFLISKFKNRVNISVIDRKITSIEIFEKFFTNSYTISSNFEDYVNGNKNVKGQLKQIIACLFSWAMGFRYLSMLFIDERKYMVFIGDPLYILNSEERFVLKMILTSIGFALAVLRTFFLIGKTI